MLLLPLSNKIAKIALPLITTFKIANNWDICEWQIIDEKQKAGAASVANALLGVGSGRKRSPGSECSEICHQRYPLEKRLNLAYYNI